MLLHFSRSDENKIHIILFPVLSSSPTTHLKVSCLPFSLFWCICLHLYLYLHSSDILFSHLNPVHSARYFQSKLYIIPFHFLSTICQSQQHFNHPVAPRVRSYTRILLFCRIPSIFCSPKQVPILLHRLRHLVVTSGFSCKISPTYYKSHLHCERIYQVL